VPHEFHSNRTGLEKFRHAAHEIVKSVKTASSDVQTMTYHLHHNLTLTHLPQRFTYTELDELLFVDVDGA
jgi:hypothetical protein